MIANTYLGEGRRWRRRTSATTHDSSSPTPAAAAPAIRGYFRRSATCCADPQRSSRNQRSRLGKGCLAMIAWQRNVLPAVDSERVEFAASLQSLPPSGDSVQRVMQRNFEACQFGVDVVIGLPPQGLRLDARLRKKLLASLLCHLVDLALGHQLLVLRGGGGDYLRRLLVSILDDTVTMGHDLIGACEGTGQVLGELVEHGQHLGAVHHCRRRHRQRSRRGNELAQLRHLLTHVHC